VDLVPDPLFLRKFGSAGNRTRDLWLCSHELLTTRPQRASLSAELLYLISHYFDSPAISIVNVILTEENGFYCNIHEPYVLPTHESYVLEQYKNVIKVNASVM
jgi:hypothetical protein